MPGMFSRCTIACFIAISIFAFDASSADTSNLEGLDWREIGPYRGGRVTTATGVPGKPNLYYMGAPGGGVWKTENAGTTWENISDDDFNVSTMIFPVALQWSQRLVNGIFAVKFTVAQVP